MHEELASSISGDSAGERILRVHDALLEVHTAVADRKADRSQIARIESAIAPILPSPYPSSIPKQLSRSLSAGRTRAAPLHDRLQLAHGVPLTPAEARAVARTPLPCAAPPSAAPPSTPLADACLAASRSRGRLAGGVGGGPAGSTPSLAPLSSLRDVQVEPLSRLPLAEGRLLASGSLASLSVLRDDGAGGQDGLGVDAAEGGDGQHTVRRMAGSDGRYYRVSNSR